MQPCAGSHTSAPLQNTPSSQSVSSGRCCTLRLASLQASTVQPTASFRAGGAPGTQSRTGSQTSAPFQAQTIEALDEVIRNFTARVEALERSLAELAEGSAPEEVWAVPGGKDGEEP